MSNLGISRPAMFGTAPLGTDETAGTDAAAEAQTATTPKDLGSPELEGGALQNINNGQTLEIGARNEDVRTLQTLLNKLGYPAGTADGIFGRGTQRAWTQFQQQQNLATSGRFDQDGLVALDKALQLGDSKSSGSRNDLVFLGMGDGGRNEIRDLQSRGVKVAGITDTAEGDDKVKIGGRIYDLQSGTDTSDFFDALGVSGDKKAELTRILGDVGPDARDETGLLMKTFLEAERGDRTLERLVLSGHSVGSGVWGDSNGDFDMSTLEDIAKAFPKAAGQVEDFMIAGCYSSSERHVQQFRAMFPNLKSTWAYGDSAPGTWSGAMNHNRRWEEATRGHHPENVTRNLAAGTRKGENVATWNIEGGYMADGETRPLDTVREEQAGMQPMLDAYLSGEADIRSTQYGPMRDYYRLVQEQLGNPHLPAGDRPGLEKQRDQTIRIIFYDAGIKAKFQEAHGQALSAGYEALGLNAPDFSQLSRKEALASVAQFEAALDNASPPPAAAEAALQLLTAGIRDLDRSVIPNTWV